VATAAGGCTEVRAAAGELAEPGTVVVLGLEKGKVVAARAKVARAKARVVVQATGTAVDEVGAGAWAVVLD
jgi:hypothetical protein